MRKLIAVGSIVAVIMGLLLVATTPAEACYTPALSPGYWMNHDWPVESVTIGGVTYSQEDGQAAMKAPVKGDKTYSMFPALVAAILNVANGADDWIMFQFVPHGQDFFSLHPLGDKVKANSPDWQYYADVFWVLDWYNNGQP